MLSPKKRVFSLSAWKEVSALSRREYRLPLPVERAPQMVITGNPNLLWGLSCAISMMENADKETLLRHNTVLDRQTRRWSLKISGGTTEELDQIRGVIPKELTVLIDCFRVKDKNKEGSQHKSGQARHHHGRSAKDLRRRGQKVAA